MINVGTVYGSKESAQPLIIGKDTVYVHTNIEKVEDQEGPDGEVIKDLYKYDEVTYTTEEWIRMQSVQSEEVQTAIDYILMSE